MTSRNLIPCPSLVPPVRSKKDARWSLKLSGQNVTSNLPRTEPPPSLPKALVGHAEPQAIDLAKFSLKIDFSKLFLLCYFGALTPGIRNDQLAKSYKLLIVLASLKFAMGALLATVHASLRITRTLPPTAIFLGGS